MPTRAELSSLSTGLHELVSRITEMADRLDGEEREQVGTDLFEVERTLRSAERRLNRLLDR
jgi:hypothetical protein